MGEYTPREGSGSLFKNTRKEKDNHPDERGDAMIGGTLYEVAAWLKKDRNGNTFRSLSIQPKQERERPQRDTGAAYRAARDGDRKPADDFDDQEIPF